MSDRKKKYISYKEANKRPPVILSKHTEYNPDGDQKIKEVNRREKSSHSNDRESVGHSSKQPTILIKARDDVQRANSPKRIQNKENEGANTQKSSGTTASSDTNPLSTPKMRNSVKLIDGHLEFNSQALEYLCDNQNDYVVVGVIGAQGVGKSTILNLIAHSNTSNLTERILNTSNKLVETILSKDDNAGDSKSSSEIYSEHSDALSNSELASNSSDSNAASYITDTLSKQISDLSLNKCASENLHKDNNEFVKFDIESEEQLNIGKHCTNGIDMYITANRVILLDTQPVISASIMDKLMSCDNKVMPTDTAIELESLQLTSFILSICHVVLLVQDWFMDTNILRFLQTADMLKPPITSALPINEEAHTENYPHIMLIQNKSTMSAFTPSSIEYMLQIYESVFQDSKMRVRSGLCGDWNKSGDKTDKKLMDRINLFLLPEVVADCDEHMYKGHDSLDQLIRVLRQKILGAARLPIAHSVISEKHWGHFSAKTWDGIKKSSFYVEYTRMLS